MDKIQYAAQITPSSRQLEWQKLEFYGFIHYGVNTYTVREWGDGSEEPNLFNPSNLNTDQPDKRITARSCYQCSRSRCQMVW